MLLALIVNMKQCYVLYLEGAGQTKVIVPTPRLWSGNLGACLFARSTEMA